MEVLNIISDHVVVFIVLSSILVINFFCILYLVFKERREDKQEIKEILEEMKPRMDSEIEDKQDKKLEENKKEVEDMLLKMQQDLESKPKDAVASFENEQEEKSIISYQELLESVKNNNDVKVTPVKLEEEKIEIEEELPKIEEKIVIPEIEEPQKIDIEDTQKIDIEDTQRINIDDDIRENSKKFKGTDFISPIFGRQENNVKYPTVPKTNSLQVEEKYDKIEKSNLIDTQKLKDSIRKNDDFLNTLKEFRRNLD